MQAANLRKSEDFCRPDTRAFCYLCDMSPERHTVVAVEYLNTALFVRGLLKSVAFRTFFDLILDYPAACTRKLLEGDAAIGLVPVASIPKIRPAFVFQDYCIGAAGPVRTVMLMADVPLNQIRKVYLDAHSLTSVQLVRILASRFWGIDPEFVPHVYRISQLSVAPDTAVLVIGDKVFETEGRYAYSWDLAEEWIRFTGTDFVFAAWVSKLPISDEAAAAFRTAMHYGYENRQELLQELISEETWSGIDVADYLTRNISYPFTGQKRKGMQLFLEMAGLPYTVPGWR